MRFKNKNDGYSFESKIISDTVRITGYIGRKKIGSDDININDYLRRETEYGRRQFLFNADVNNVKTDSEQVEYCCVASRNLDFIHQSINHALEEADLFIPTLGAIVEAKRKASIEPVAPVKPIKPLVKTITETTMTENYSNPISQKQTLLAAFA